MPKYHRDRPNEERERAFVLLSFFLPRRVAGARLVLSRRRSPRRRRRSRPRGGATAGEASRSLFPAICPAGKVRSLNLEISFLDFDGLEKRMESSPAREAGEDPR